MTGLQSRIRGRTFLAGKLIFNFGQSSIDCTIRRLSDDGATLELESGLGVPERFLLTVAGESEALPCRLSWQSEKQIGASFESATAAETGAAKPAEERSADHALRSQMLALRAAFDHVPLGIVLLDARLTARFINRAFRRMWALTDEVADRHPSFAALMYHGRDTTAYEVATPDLEAYVAKRIELVLSGDTTPIDLRRSKGDVVRMQCTPLPDGGRMLSYTEVTDIVRHSDELKILRDALENVHDGIVLLDPNLNATFLNRKVRQFWEISEEQAARHPSYASLISRARRAVDPNLAPREIAGFAARRAAEVKAGDHVRDLKTPDGRRLRAHCTNMTGGGRMLTYIDITDLIRNAEELERLATTDTLTGLYNRRHLLNALEAEWSRFQRYYRSLSVLMLDIDHFKAVNDDYGHAIGDDAIKMVANACLEGKRKSDIVGRLGGEEFAVLLPETSLSRATIVAERIRKRIAAQMLKARDVHFHVTASIGIAEASVSMSGTEALMNAADQALYQAKEAGRNRSVCWSPPPAAKLAAE